MPAQDRCRGGQQSAAAMSGQKSGEDGDHGPVTLTDLWSGCAALQHGKLMAQNEDLDLVGGVGAGVEHYPAQQLAAWVGICARCSCRYGHDTDQRSVLHCDLCLPG
jgi:hypothetical protein